MKRKEIAQILGLKLQKIRKNFNKSRPKMAVELGCDRASYLRNENGKNIPNFFTTYNLATQFDISLNWFILDEGPMYLREITSIKNVEPAPPPLAEDLKELVDHMEKMPLLRHEILAHFHRFKEEHPLMEKQ